MKCEHKGRFRSCHNTPMTGGDYCPEHSPYKCEKSGCETPVELSGRYCPEHLCLHDGCTRDQMGNSQCCYVHVCQVCGKEDRGPDDYCVEHACTFNSACHRSRQRGGPFCFIHGCASCGRRLERGDLCVEHVCARGTCHELSRAGSPFCKDHGVHDLRKNAGYGGIP